MSRSSPGYVKFYQNKSIKKLVFLLLIATALYLKVKQLLIDLLNYSDTDLNLSIGLNETINRALALLEYYKCTEGPA